MFKLYVPAKNGIFELASAIFKKYYQEMTGVLLEEVAEDDGNSDLVIFGSDSINPLVHDKILNKIIPPLGLEVNGDSYRILSAKDAGRTLLFLSGGRNRAILYAVYHYFELNGCRWFWDGDIVPKKENLSIEGWDIFEVPRFQYRGLRYFAHRSLKRFQAEHWDIEDWQKELDWCLKKRFNLFMLRIGWDDVFQKAFPEIVKYPGWEVPESQDRSYNDRNLFWSLEYRGKLRKMVLSYARERDLMHPEDCGTMSHWYTRTPKSFLEAINPKFLPQSTAGYSDPTGLVWDIRNDKNLDNYFKLTETHIKEYGSPEIFHTIGLSERKCYADSFKNHQMKLYTYRRIISKLRSKYPNAPLLIGTWDLCMYWKPEEIWDFIRELDPENTILFDYTCDTDNELNNFTNWDVKDKFPWIFGLFHAFEFNSDMRGHYDIIERRLRTAKDDSMCKGMVYWPECSHTDTLILEYVAANSWSPCDSNRKIASFIEKFVSDRYEKHTESMRSIWHKFLPVLKMRGFTGPMQPHSFMISDIPFKPLDCVEWDILGTPSENTIAVEKKFLKDHAETVKLIPQIFRDLAELDLDSADEFIRRDVVDIARSSALRLMFYGYFKLTALYNDWRRGKTEDRDSLLGLLQLLGETHKLLTMILASHKDYSMLETLRELQRKHECNPNFEHTLKGNASNGYCRSFQYELTAYMYMPEFEVYAEVLRNRLMNNDRREIDFATEQMGVKRDNILDRFFDTPLTEMALDIELMYDKLDKTLMHFAEVGNLMISENTAAGQIDAFAKAALL